MRFLFIGSRFTLHASSPRSVALTQLRFTSLTVVSSREDLHLQECARAGRTTKGRLSAPFVILSVSLLELTGRCLLPLICVLKANLFQTSAFRIRQYRGHVLVLDVRRRVNLQLGLRILHRCHR